MKILLEKANISEHIKLGRVSSEGENILGYPIKKISDYHDIELHLTDGYYSDGGHGLHNGYSRYSCINANNTIALAYCDQPALNMCYDLNGNKLGPLLFRPKMTSSDTKQVGETNDVRWSGKVGEDDIFYCKGIYVSDTCIYKCRAFHPEEQKLVIDFSIPYPVNGKIYGGIKETGHGGQSADAHYRSIYFGSLTSVVIDLWENKLVTNPIDGSVLEFINGGETEISPSGKWALHNTSSSGQFFFDLETFLATGEKIEIPMPTTSHGHDGWAINKQGKEVYIYQDNKTDWYCAFEPKSLGLTKIFNMGPWGYTGWNQHMSVMESNVSKGWFLMSVYSDESHWMGDQLLLIEIEDSSVSRILRIGDYLNLYNFTSPLDKNKQYFAEGFASITKDCQRITFGANKNGTAPLDLYFINLPTDFWNKLNSIPQSTVGEFDYDTMEVIIPDPVVPDPVVPDPVVDPDPIIGNIKSLQINLNVKGIIQGINVDVNIAGSIIVNN